MTIRLKTTHYDYAGQTFFPKMKLVSVILLGLIGLLTFDNDSVSLALEYFLIIGGLVVLVDKYE